MFDSSSLFFEKVFDSGAPWLKIWVKRFLSVDFGTAALCTEVFYANSNQDKIQYRTVKIHSTTVVQHIIQVSTRI